MSIATLEEVAVWDDEGNVEGLQFDGRERRIQEWKDRKEAEEFAALVERLQKRNSNRRRWNDPEKRERMRLADIKHRRSGRKQQRANERRREQYEAEPVINTCVECGHQEAVPYEKRGARASQFCSRKCRNRAHGRKRQRAKGLRKMDIKPAAFRFLRSVEFATAAEVAEAIDGKLQSVRVCLSRWAKAGEVVSDGCRPARYSINQPPDA